jgi:transposase
VQKPLESANVKLGSVLTDVLGPSGRAIVEVLVTGETDAERLADRLHARSQAKRPAVVAARHGARLQPHQRMLLRQHLTLIGSVEASVAAIETEIETEIATALEALRAAVDRLVTVPGIRTTAAAVVIAEIGGDMTRFPTAGHLRS